MTLTFGSLFAGIGGFDLGLERAGMECAWQVEIDDYATRVLEKHWPDVKRYRDVRECRAGDLSAVDVICGGFPCQPHSYAGKRKGAEDDRDLWPEFKRIIDELRPRWVVAENVPGIRTTILDTVLSDLEGMGYTWQAAVIPACAVDAPHRRDRIWIVAYDDSKRSHRIVCNQAAGKRQKRWRYIRGNGCKTTEEQRSRSQWLPEPGVGRVVDGISNRVDRLRGLGNAVVPQVVEFIGRQIVEVDSTSVPAQPADSGV